VRSTPYILTGAGTVPFTLNFKINTLPSFGEFSSLFDRYRIKYVMIKVYYGSTTMPSSTASPAPETGYLHYAIDYNDSIAPSSVDELLQYQSYKCVPLNKLQGYKIFIKPRWELTAYRDGALSAYGNGPRTTWLDLYGNGPDIPHYGFKSIIEKAGDPTERHLVFATTFFMEFSVVH